MNATWISTAAALLLGGVIAFTNPAQDAARYRTACLTHADVAHHAARSRTGLSATCDESVRARNAAR